MSEGWEASTRLVTCASSPLAEGHTIQESIYAWESLGMGKYLTALAISGSVYLMLLFLVDTNVLWGLKARFSDLNRKRQSVSGSACNSGTRVHGLARQFVVGSGLDFQHLTVSSPTRAEG